MSNPAGFPGPDARGLFALFPPAEYLARSDLVAPDEIPQPYFDLLVHEHHMTVTVEAHHGDLVEVQVLAERRGQESYARKILLALQKSRRVVQFGVMRIHFRYCSEAIRDEILSGKTPLGRVLIQHGVLRRIQPIAYLRIVPAPALMQWFGIDAPRPTYGRLAMIHCDERPAVELLEIVAPE